MGIRRQANKNANRTIPATSPIAAPPTHTNLAPMREFKPRNTTRARELRREATPMERKLWRYLSGGALGAKFSRQMHVVV